MEPVPTNAFIGKAVLVGAVAAALVAIGGCAPEIDAPARPPQADRPAVQSEQSEQPPAPAVARGAPGPQTVLSREAPEREGSIGPASERGPLEADRDESQEQPDLPVVAAQLRAESGETVTPQNEAPETHAGAGEREAEAASAGDEPPEPHPPVEEAVPGEPPLPPPMVDDPEGLQQLHPSYPVWIDRDRKHVIMVGRVCQRRAPLELFACIRHSKEHESVVAVDTQAYVVHAGLLAAEAEPGSPVQFVPEFAPPTGTEIEVTVVWEDASGRRRQARAQDWVRDVAGLYEAFNGVVANEFDDELSVHDQPDAFQDMQYPWVFAGSLFLVDEQTGRRSYVADGEGDLICVSNFPSAVLDVPIRSSDSNAALMFEAFTERIPPIGTPVTLILTPQIEKKSGTPGQTGDQARLQDGSAARKAGD